MQVLITPHAMMSPLNQTTIDADEFFLHYTLLKYISSRNDIFSSYIYNDTIDILAKSNLYPSFNAFHDYINENELSDFVSANDLTTLFNHILSNCEGIDEQGDIFDIEIDENEDYPIVSTTPICNIATNSLHIHCGYLNSLEGYNVISLLDSNLKLEKYNTCIPTLTLLKSDDSIVELDNFTASVDITSSCVQLINHCNPQTLWDKSRSSESLRISIYIKCQELIKNKTVEYEGDFAFDSFDIGDRFYESLQANQCIDGRFSSSTLECVSRLLLCKPKNELKVFTTTAGGSEPRKRGQDIAYRTHLTKFGLGLRLMVWKLPCGSYELANVGTKQELEIL